MTEWTWVSAFLIVACDNPTWHNASQVFLNICKTYKQNLIIKKKTPSQELLQKNDKSMDCLIKLTRCVKKFKYILGIYKIHLQKYLLIFLRIVASLFALYDDVQAHLRKIKRPTYVFLAKTGGIQPRECVFIRNSDAT